MTITSEINRVGPLPGNDAATVFSFSPMQVLSADDLLVVKVGNDGSETTLTRGAGSTNYSVSVASFPGTGSITYPASGGTPLAADETLVIIRDLDFTQLTVLENQGGYFPKVQEGVFDRLTILLQQLKEEISRAIRITVGQSQEDADDFIAELIEASAEASAAAATATAAAEAAALFDPDNYVATAGDTMTGPLLIEGTASGVSRFETTGTGNGLKISHLQTGQPEGLIWFSPKSGTGTGSAKVNFFRETNTTGAKVIEFNRGNATSTVSASITVTADGLDLTSGQLALTDATYERPFVVNNIRVWEDTGSNVLRWKSGSDPSSASDGGLIAPFSQKFESSEQVISSLTDDYNVAHGLTLSGSPSPPLTTRTVLVCKTTELGYAVGDEVEVRGWQTTADAGEGVSVWANDTNMGMAHTGLKLIHKTTPAAPTSITPANWRVKFYAAR